MKEDEALVSPVGTLFVERYKDKAAALEKLTLRRSEIQCVTCRKEEIPSLSALLDIPVVAFGDAQCPSLWDYADGEDTLDFLLSLYPD